MTLPAEPLGPFYEALQLWDLDGDGRLDLVAEPFFIYAVSVRRGRGDGTFEPHEQKLRHRCHWTAIADYDGDGRRDVAVSLPTQQILTLINETTVPLARPADLKPGSLALLVRTNPVSGPIVVDLTLPSSAPARDRGVRCRGTAGVGVVRSRARHRDVVASPSARTCDWLRGST